MVVADGMGGHRHGEIAAQLAVKTLTEAFQRMAMPVLADPAKFLSDHIRQIHDTIDSFTLVNDLPDAPRTTIVAAILQHGELYCAHVGDSRLYHFRDGHLLYRTEDHSIVQMLYRQGQLAEQDMLTHPARHKIYNCLGGERPPQIELTPTRSLSEGDSLLLCTDGLWSGLSDEKIGEILHSGFVSHTVPTLLDAAEAINGENGDNLSAIGLQWGDRQDSQMQDTQLQHGPLTVSTTTMPWSVTTTIMNPIARQQTQPDDAHAAPDLTDEEIERAIAEIQAAIGKTKR